MPRSAVLSIVAVVWCLLAAGAASAQVVINEIHYNSPGSPDVEFIELTNIGATAVTLDGWFLIDNNLEHDPCLLSGTLPPGGFYAVPGRLDLFIAAYPGVTAFNPIGCTAGDPDIGFGWGNSADIVSLYDNSDTLADEVAYEDGGEWPGGADGDGASLELINPLFDNARASNWVASPAGPTPGAANGGFADDPAPEVEALTRLPLMPGRREEVTVRATVFDNSVVTVDLYVDRGQGYVATPMADDGLNADGTEGDGVFGVTIDGSPLGQVVRYYVEATDASQQVTRFPQGAPTDHRAFKAGARRPNLRITELLASNLSVSFDEAGDADDWLEIHNAGPTPVSLDGLFLGEDLDESTTWPFPAMTLAPDERVVVWCDDEALEGPLHATFRLARDGGEVWIFDSLERGNLPIDGITYGPQVSDISFGFAYEGANEPDLLVPPTPGAVNTGSGVFSAILINEVLAAGSTGEDWIELYNSDVVTRAIGNWYLTDDPDEPLKYRFPPGTSMPPGSFLRVDRSTLGFGFSADGSEVVMLVFEDRLTTLDYLDLGPQAEDVSYGRFPDGGSGRHAMQQTTPAAANTCLPTVTCSPRPVFSPELRRPSAGPAERPRGRR